MKVGSGKRAAMAQSEVMSIVLFVSRLKIEAHIKTQGYRLLDILNDPLHEYLEIQDARLSARGMTIARELSDAVVSKSEISVAVVPSERHEAEERRRFIAVDKKRYPVLLMTDGFDVRGTVHLDGPPDPSVALAGELEQFFAITDASVAHAATGERLEAPVVMPNKRLVSVFHIGELIREMERRAA